MKAFEGTWTCPFCNLETFLPPKIGKVFNNRDAWWVRKAGLFAKDNNQEGAIPTILTLLAFARILDGGEFLYSTALECKLEKLQCETDLCILHYGRGADIEIAIGECKALGRITEDDSRKMTALRNKFQNIGLNCYIVFAKTDDSFSQDEEALFRKMRNETIPLVLFTSNELEPYEPYRQDADNSLPVKFPMSLGDMARNSDFIYLRE